MYDVDNFDIMIIAVKFNHTFNRNHTYSYCYTRTYSYVAVYVGASVCAVLLTCCMYTMHVCMYEAVARACWLLLYLLILFL